MSVAFLDFAAVPSPAPVEVDRQRVSASIAVLRIAATIGIVAFHAGVGPFGLIGVMIFVALSLGLYKDEPLAAFLARKARRIIAPWIAWSLVFGIMTACWGLRRHLALDRLYLPEMWLYGTKIHLWFLPFLFCASLALYAARRSMPTDATRYLWLAAAPVAVMVSSSLVAQIGFAAPLGQWVTALPAVAIGIAYVALRDDAHPETPLALLVVFVLLTAATASILYGPGIARAASVAIVALAAAWSLQSFAAPAWLASLSNLTFGVYLIHPAYLSLLKTIVPSPLGMVTAALLLSAATTAAIRHSRLRWMV